MAGVGHYLLLPSSSSLLIKPVVVSELLLPVETAGEGDKPTPDAMDSIAASLDQVSQYKLMSAEFNYEASLLKTLAQIFHH